MERDHKVENGKTEIDEFGTTIKIEINILSSTELKIFCD